MVWLRTSTWSLLDATTAIDSPAAWAASHRRAIVVEVDVEGAGVDPAVTLVGVEGGGVAVSQLERRGGLPGVGEPVEPLERLDATVGAQLGDESAAADGLQLARITDQGETPPSLVDETDQVVEIGRRQHPGLVHDHGAAGGHVEDAGERGVVVPVVEERRQAGVAVARLVLAAIA